MKIATRIAIVFSMAGVALFGSYAIYLIYQEGVELRAATEREVRTLGRSLQASIEHALRDRQVEDVEALLARLSSTGPVVRVLVYTAEGELLASTPGTGDSDPAFGEAAREAIEDGRSRLSYIPADEPFELALALPLGEAADAGAVLIARSLADMREDLRGTRLGIVLSVSLFVVVAIVLGVVLGHFYIARPLARVGSAMRNLRTGEFPFDLPVGRDELGEVALEFNELVRQLRDARGRLEAELERRRHLEQAVQRTDKLITIGQLSAGLAHDIGSPLQVLNGRAHALLNRADDATATRHNAQIIIRETDRITRMVERLLRVSRRRAASFGTVDIAATARTVTELLEIEARRRSVRLRLIMDEAPVPPLRGDVDQLQQALLNLVSNALQATPGGGTVELGIAQEEGRMRLSVSDTGHGMDAAVEAQIFEPFFTTRQTEGGTGLGLAVVKAIVDEHGGTVSVASTPGAGSTFTIRLPLEGADGRGAAPGGASQ